MILRLAVVLFKFSGHLIFSGFPRKKQSRKCNTLFLLPLDFIRKSIIHRELKSIFSIPNWAAIAPINIPIVRAIFIAIPAISF